VGRLGSGKAGKPKWRARDTSDIAIPRHSAATMTGDGAGPRIAHPRLHRGQDDGTVLTAWGNGHGEPSRWRVSALTYPSKFGGAYQ